MNLLVDESLMSYATPMVYSGLKAARHNPKGISTFDTFDITKPDIYIADADWLNETVFKNIEERPAMRVVVIQKNDNRKDHPNLQKLQERFGDVYLWIINDGHADLLEYTGSQNFPPLKSDVVSVEDNPVNGIENLQLPSNIVVKVFSSTLVNSNYFCGFISNEMRKNAYKSAKLSISQGNNIYNSILCDCLPVDVNSNILDILNSDNTEKIKEFKNIIYNSKNNFIDAANIFDNLGITQQSKIILEKMKELI